MTQLLGDFLHDDPGEGGFAIRPGDREPVLAPGALDPRGFGGFSLNYDVRAGRPSRENLRNQRPDLPFQIWEDVADGAPDMRFDPYTVHLGERRIEMMKAQLCIQYRNPQ